MKKRSHYNLPESAVTEEGLYARRREFLKLGAALAASPLFAGDLGTYKPREGGLKPTREKLVTSYNNYFEFGTGKGDPARYAHTLQTDPWVVRVDGLVEKPQTIDVNDLLMHKELEERIYRLRCVEGWSMVIPWVGLELNRVLKAAKPLSKAKYVRFETLADEKQMRTVGSPFAPIPYPYVEGLRLDEAMHPLTILSVGLYGKKLLPQNGAPVRLVVPWKYGFKSIKSIVRITLTGEMPKNTWQVVTPNEYGFYANVNPNVPHPRWSQAKERIIGSFRKRETEMFNGYGTQVADLYKGMDLKRWY